MDYGNRVKEMTKTVHLDLYNKNEVLLNALQMKVKCMFGLGDRVVQKHLEQLKELGLVEIDGNLVKVINKEAIKELIV